MMSPVGGGMPSMDAMRLMQQQSRQRFDAADADGSGGLDATEFDAMVRASPLGPRAGAGDVDAQAALQRIDADGNGEASQAELDAAHEQAMSRFRSTLQAFGGAAGATGAAPSSDQATTETDDLVAQLRSLIERVTSAYTAGSHDPTPVLRLAA